jgi:hypothetical protein
MGGISTQLGWVAYCPRGSGIAEYRVPYVGLRLAHHGHRDLHNPGQGWFGL